MNYLAMNDTADNGYRVQSIVTLLWEDDEPFSDKPWRATTSVRSHTMCTSHHRTCAEAKAHAEKMHAAYLEVHADSDYKRAVQAAIA